MAGKLLHGLYWLLFFIAMSAGHAAQFCANSLSDEQAEKLFRNATLAQLRLEFGDLHLKVYDVQSRAVAQDIVAFNARVDYHKPGTGQQKSSTRINAWVSLCQGTTIIRGNTWLADGSLSVERFGREQLTGSGMVYGTEDAPLQVIAFVDSRCSHCHRLMSYAQALLDAGKLRLELRQVAYLESVDEAVLDSRLSETELAGKGHAGITKAAYWEFLSGFANEEPVKQNKYLDKAREIITQNTQVARELVKINTVPGVLVRDKGFQDYRLASYWEMNRLFLPEN